MLGPGSGAVVVATETLTIAAPMRPNVIPRLCVKEYCSSSFFHPRYSPLPTGAIPVVVGEGTAAVVRIGGPNASAGARREGRGGCRTV